MPARVAAVLLAAGGSSRLGVPKQLLTIAGKPLVRRAARSAIDAGLSPVHVVLGAHADDVAAALCEEPIQVVLNTDWPTGVASSIRAGVSSLHDADVDALVLMVCDQPRLASQVLRELLDAHARFARPIVASRYGGSLGTPALFARGVWHELNALGADTGAKPVILRDPTRVAVVDFPQGAWDVDAQADAARLDDDA